jgi:radical SAM superfamily enzyme YgiQ (UPF0313 family)
MKILLVSPNVESLPDPVFPLGLAYITASLKRNHIRYQVLDLGFVEDYEAAIESDITSFKPDIIGLSLRNLDNVCYPNYISYLPFYRQVVQILRRQSKGLIVVGGSGFSLMPEEVLEYLGADLGIAGEGEIFLVRLINELKSKKGVYNSLIPRIIGRPSEIIENLDVLPIPDRAGFDNTAYLKWGGMGNIQTKRGCPFGCIYCTYPIIEGKRVRLRNPRLICDEIESMLEYGIDSFFFVDNTFNYPIDHAQAICQEIIRRNLPVQWSCYVNPRFITPKLIELMLSSGCTGLEFGSDAANKTMLFNLGKNFTANDLNEASAICKKSGLPFCHNLLLGGPGETMETVHHTLDAIINMSPTAVICMIGIRVFPKTKLSLIAMEEGMIGPEEDFLKPVFYLSPATENKVLPFIEGFSKENPTWIFPGLNINITVGLQKKLRRFGIKGPLWEHMKIGERFRKRFY